MNDFKSLIENTLKDTGFGVRVYDNGLFVYLKNRNVAVSEVANALGESIDLFEKVRLARDAHRYNRTGVLLIV